MLLNILPHTVKPSAAKNYGPQMSVGLRLRNPMLEDVSILRRVSQGLIQVGQE